MPRFVLLYHDTPPGYVRGPHWDLMLEDGGSLRTWALAELPAAWAAARQATALAHLRCPDLATCGTVAAERLGDHRLAYLDHEGPVGDDRGMVTRIDHGRYTSLAESPTYWRLALDGRHVPGTIELEQSEVDASRWTLRCD